MKETKLLNEHIKLNAKMTPFAGFNMPLYYESIAKEHLAVRHQVGIFDVSHMGELLITGNDALSFVNKIVTNTISDTPNKVTYALLLNEKGQVLDDLLVYVYNQRQVLLVVNASNIDIDALHIKNQIENEDIIFKNISEEMMQVAIQGPKAKKVVETIFNQSFELLTFMTFKTISYQDEQILISRTGYTGEDGFEIYGKDKQIIDIWQKALQFDVTPCGLGARDTLRFEANLPLYGHEITQDIHPYESGLKFAVKLDKSFIGKDIINDQINHLTHRLYGIEMINKGIPRQHYPVLFNDEEIGYITTGYLLPERNKGLGIAYLKKGIVKIGDIVDIKIRNKTYQAKIRNRKFYQKQYVK